MCVRAPVCVGGKHNEISKSHNDSYIHVSLADFPSLSHSRVLDTYITHVCLHMKLIFRSICDGPGITALRHNYKSSMCIHIFL